MMIGGHSSANGGTYATNTGLRSGTGIDRHRGGDPGTIRIEHPTAHSTRIISTTVYPDDLFYGLMYGLLRRVVKHGHYVVQYATQMDKGDPETILDVTWKT
jgi:hypothetical protein